MMAVFFDERELQRRRAAIEAVARIMRKVGGRAVPSSPV